MPSDFAELDPETPWNLPIRRVDLGQTEGGSYVFGARAHLSPDGSRLVFASNTPPSASFVVDPPDAPPPGRTWLYLQQRDGSDRRVVASYDNESPFEDVIGYGARMNDQEDRFVDSYWTIFAGHRMFDVFPVANDGNVFLDGRFWHGPSYDTETAGVFAWTPGAGARSIVAGTPDGLIRHHYGVAVANGARRLVFWSDAAELPIVGAPARLYVAPYGW